MLYISCLCLFLGHFNHIFKIRIMLTNLFSSMGTTLLRLCLPLNHKHNTDPSKLPAQCQTDSLNPAHKNSPLGVRQIRIILLHPNLIHRPQCLTPEPKTPEPKAPCQILNYSRPGLKTNNPPTYIGGLPRKQKD